MFGDMGGIPKSLAVPYKVPCVISPLSALNVLNPHILQIKKARHKDTKKLTVRVTGLVSGRGRTGTDSSQHASFPR